MTTKLTDKKTKQLQPMQKPFKNHNLFPLLIGQILTVRNQDVDLHVIMRYQIILINTGPRVELVTN